MKQEVPEFNEMEWRITALILGELPPEEAAQVQDEIERQPELKVLHERLKGTIQWVREVVAFPNEFDSETRPRLNPDRRERLLTQLRTVPLKAALNTPKRPWRSWVVPLASAAVLIGVLALPLLFSPFGRITQQLGDLSTLAATDAANFHAGERTIERVGPSSGHQSVTLGDRPTFGREFSASASPQSQTSSRDEREVLARRSAPSAGSFSGLPSQKFASGAGGQMPLQLSDSEQAPAKPSDDAENVQLGLAGAATSWALSDTKPLVESEQRSRRLAAPGLSSILESPASEGLAAGLASPGKVEDKSVALFVEPAPAAPPNERFGNFGELQSDVSSRYLSNAFSSYYFRGRTGEELPSIREAERDMDMFENARDLQESLNFGGRAVANGKKVTKEEIGAPKLSLRRKAALQKQVKVPEISQLARDRVSTLAASIEPTAQPARKALPLPQPEVQTAENAFSTFSLNVTDVSFKMAAASLQNGSLPDPAAVRSEEFLNAMNYRDPEPLPGTPLAFAWERSRWPFAQNRDLLRLSVKTAASGRAPGTPMNLVLLLDNSGSMERADRVQIVEQALRVLGGKLQSHDKFSLVTFARTPRVWLDGLNGQEVPKRLEDLGGFTPEGGTNLEEGLRQAYDTALANCVPEGKNRIVLLTDGAANLGNVDAEALREMVAQNRQQGIALDCFGVGWEGYNDDLLEALSRNGDGRYGFLNNVEQAASEFGVQLAGALQVFASDVKVQVQFNPERVKAYRQIGYAKHQLTQEQFRDNAVDAAEIGAAESGTAAYIVEVDASGQGPLATVRVRYRDAQRNSFEEQEWVVPYTGATVPLEQASPSLRLAGVAVGFAEWLSNNPYAGEVNPDRLLAILQGVPQFFNQDPRPQNLEWMLRQAKSVSGQ